MENLTTETDNQRWANPDNWSVEVASEMTLEQWIERRSFIDSMLPTREPEKRIEKYKFEYNNLIKLSIMPRMGGKCLPVKDDFVKDSFRKKIQFLNNKE